MAARRPATETTSSTAPQPHASGMASRTVVSGCTRRMSARVVFPLIPNGNQGLAASMKPVEGAYIDGEAACLEVHPPVPNAEGSDDSPSLTSNLAVAAPSTGTGNRTAAMVHWDFAKTDSAAAKRHSNRGSACKPTWIPLPNPGSRRRQLLAPTAATSPGVPGESEFLAHLRAANRCSDPLPN